VSNTARRCVVLNLNVALWRREDLNNYWQKVIGIDKIAEFNKHHCSEALKLFLDVDGALRGGSEKVAADEIEAEAAGNDGGDADGEAAGEGGPKKSGGAGSRRLSSRASRYVDACMLQS
jgi:hypothetical protein